MNSTGITSSLTLAKLQQCANMEEARSILSTLTHQELMELRILCEKPLTNVFEVDIFWALLLSEVDTVIFNNNATCGM